MEYDSIGRLVKKQLPLGMSMEIAYEDAKRKVTITDYNKKPIVYTYNSDMRLATKEVGGETTSYDYTNEGQIKTVTDKKGIT